MPETTLLTETMRHKALSRVAPLRRLHILGVEQIADTLALRWGVDRALARNAALLHDVTKSLNVEEQLKLCEKYDIIARLRSEEFRDPSFGKLLHAETGAMVARHEFGQPDAVCEAIVSHTLGDVDMSPLAKITYLSDWIEPGRTFPELRALRALSFLDLDAALISAFDLSLHVQMMGGRTIHTRTIAARNHLLMDRQKQK